MAAAGSRSVLPDVIDYACGAGHFLTKAIVEVDGFFDDARALPAHKTALAELEQERVGYHWAHQHMYGIDGDYRLARAKQHSAARFVESSWQANVAALGVDIRDPCDT